MLGRECRYPAAKMSIPHAALLGRAVGIQLTLQKCMSNTCLKTMAWAKRSWFFYHCGLTKMSWPNLLCSINELGYIKQDGTRFANKVTLKQMTLHYLGRTDIITRERETQKRDQRDNGARIGLIWFALMVGDRQDSRTVSSWLLEAEEKQGNQFFPQQPPEKNAHS